MRNKHRESTENDTVIIALANVARQEQRSGPALPHIGQEADLRDGKILCLVDDDMIEGMPAPERSHPDLGLLKMNVVGVSRHADASMARPI